MKLSPGTIDRLLSTADTLMWMSEAFRGNEMLEKVRAQIVVARETKNEAFEAELLPLLQEWVEANQPYVVKAIALIKKHYG
jgi:hypothetical protein